jgi:uncharacterized SAM-binding protein YcdF (DUF218 family)
MIDTEPRNTYVNATGTKRLLRPVSNLIVSSASHLPRAELVFTKQGFRVTPAPCDYVSQDRLRESWDDIDMSNILTNENALQQTREAVAEVERVVIYGPAGKLWQDAENLAFFQSMVGCSHTS